MRNSKDPVEMIGGVPVAVPDPAITAATGALASGVRADDD